MAVLQWKRCPRNLSRYWLFLFAVCLLQFSVHCLRFESALLLKTNVVWTSKSKKRKKKNSLVYFSYNVVVLFIYLFS